MFKVSCPAKINLFLKLTGKRPNGYHELESLFAFLDLADELEVTKLSQNLENPQIEIVGEFGELVDEKNNLFTKILNYFADQFKISKNLHIKITKNIPVGAGLGGGSSDAAFFMKALNEIFSLKLSKIELQKISINFGSDIAFFFEDQASIVKGCGELIENFSSFEPIPTLLINPKIHLSTKEIFSKFDGNFSQEISNAILQRIDVLELIKTLPNCLTKSAIANAAKIAEILDEMKNEGAEIAKMSGSGSTCFAIFDSEDQLEIAYQNFTKKFPEFFVRKSKILSNYHSN